MSTGGVFLSVGTLDAERVKCYLVYLQKNVIERYFHIQTSDAVRGALSKGCQESIYDSLKQSALGSIMMIIVLSACCKQFVCYVFLGTVVIFV